MVTRHSGIFKVDDKGEHEAVKIWHSAQNKKIFFLYLLRMFKKLEV